MVLKFTLCPSSSFQKGTKIVPNFLFSVLPTSYLFMHFLKFVLIRFNIEITVFIKVYIRINRDVSDCLYLSLNFQDRILGRLSFCYWSFFFVNRNRRVLVVA